jgi:sodium/potassium/calcium exchanger 6
MGYPSMAIAACFGGPMLNILLGVGLSGTYLILVNAPADDPHKPIHIDMGRTLLVSGVGLFAILLGSLIVVPLNNYRMSKRVGACLIASYTVRLPIFFFLNTAY